MEFIQSCIAKENNVHVVEKCCILFITVKLSAYFLAVFSQILYFHTVFRNILAHFVWRIEAWCLSCIRAIADLHLLRK